MAVLDVLNLNLGTEQNPNWVLHDLHDKRISTTAVTTATHLLATNAGVTAMNPITAANLASVLGAFFPKSYGRNHDPDTYLETGAGYCEIVAEKSPTGTYRGWFYIVIKFYDNRDSVLQLITQDNAVSKDWYYRKGHPIGGTVNWTSWSIFSYDIPSFYKNYSTLKSIAEAAGACYAYTPLQNADDFNNYTHTGFVLVYSVAIAAGIQNAPDNIGYGYLEIKRINSDRIMQTYTKWGGKTFYAYRYFENNSWSTWKYS